MSLIAEFSLRSPDLALATTLDAAPGMTVELEHQMASRADAPVALFWAFGGDFDRLADGLERDETVLSSAVVEESDAGRLYRTRFDTDRLVAVYPHYQRLGAAPLAATGTREGWKRRVRFPDRESVVEMREFCANEGVTFCLQRLYAPDGTGLEDEFGLSAEQREALATAQRAGYFDVPRRVSLAELGDRLDISGQSASERVRRGVSRLLTNTVLSDFS